MANATQPNIFFIMSDHHAAHAIGAYGNSNNETPQLDCLAHEGSRFDTCFCTNSICRSARRAGQRSSRESTVI